MSKEKEKPGIMMYWEMFDVLEILIDGQAKTMLRAIRNYSQYGEAPDFENDKLLETLWMLVKPKIDADSDRYEQIREQRRKAGKTSAEKRYSQSNECQQPSTSVSKCQQIQPTTSTSTTTSSSSETSPNTSKGMMDNEKMDNGLTLTCQPASPENAEFEEKRRVALERLQEVNTNGL